MMSMGIPRDLCFIELFGVNAYFVPSFPGKQKALHKTDALFLDALLSSHIGSLNFDQFLNFPVDIEISMAQTLCTFWIFFIGWA